MRKIHVLIRRLTAPRRLVALAIILTGMGLVAGYVDAQKQADLTLALRKGPPAPVAAQEFDARAHEGRSAEVVIRGEVNADQGVLLSLRGTDPAERAWIAPLYPLSEMGRALLVSGQTEGEVAVTDQVARRTEKDTDPAAALGYVLFRIAPDATAPVAARDVAKDVHGSGDYGTVVTLNGTLARDSRFAAQADGALAALGLGLLSDPLVVAPFPEGRLSALSTYPAEGSHEWVYTLALLILVLAAAESLRRSLLARSPIPALAGGRDVAASDGFDETPRAAHPTFAPLPSQDELARVAEAPESVRPATGLAALVSRFRSRR